jgi:hypothetical protein
MEERGKGAGREDASARVCVVHSSRPFWRQDCQQIEGMMHTVRSRSVKTPVSDQLSELTFSEANLCRNSHMISPLAKLRAEQTVVALGPSKPGLSDTSK